MRLFRYRKIDKDTFGINLQKDLFTIFPSGISCYQVQEEILKSLKKRGYVIMQFYEPKKSHPFFRFMIIFYLLCILAMAIGRPIKWLFTGNSKYSVDGWGYKLLRWWNDKLGFDFY